MRSDLSGSLLFHTIKHDFISYFGHFCTKYAVKECFFHANYKEVTAYGG
nr:MAG TPA: hypothetical protein [Caudoviricetes sp.]